MTKRHLSTVKARSCAVGQTEWRNDPIKRLYDYFPDTGALARPLT